MRGIRNTNAEKRNNSVIFLTGAVYLLTLGLSYLLPPGGRIYSYGLIMQFASLLLPAVLYCAARGDRLTKKMRMNGFSPAKTVFLLLFTLAIFCGSVLISLLMGNGAAASDAVSSEPRAVALICLAILPALAEELFFRGIVMTELEESGSFTAVTLSALLFAMFHFSLKGLPVYLFSGIMLALCAYVTRSVLASCTVHLLYNLAVILGAEKINAFFAITDNVALVCVVLTMVLLICLILIFGECQRTYSAYSEQNARSPQGAKGGKGSFFIALFSPASAICIIIFITALLI